MDCSPPHFSVHGISQGKNTGVGCQGMFPTKGSNVHLLHWQVDSVTLSLLGSLLPKLYIEIHYEIHSDYPTSLMHWSHVKSTVTIQPVPFIGAKRNYNKQSRLLLISYCFCSWNWSPCFSLPVLNDYLEILRAIKELLLSILEGTRFGGD